MSKAGLFAGVVGSAPADNAPTDKQKGYHFMQWDTNVLVGISDPCEIPGCLLWLDGGDPTDGGAGTDPLVWYDKSGNSNHYSSLTAPQFPTVAGDGSMRFDPDVGAFPYVEGPDFSTLTEGEIFARLKIDANPPANAAHTGLWNFRGNVTFSDSYPSTQSVPNFVGKIRSTWGSTTEWIQSTPVSEDLTTYHNLNIWSATNDWSLLINQIEQVALASNVVSFIGNGGSSFIGSFISGSAPMKGNFKQVILYDHKLTGTERLQLHIWLDTK